MRKEKVLKIYKENDDYVIERINQFNNSFKRQYSKAGLVEALQFYRVDGQLDEHELETIFYLNYNNRTLVPLL